MKCMTNNKLVIHFNKTNSGYASIASTSQNTDKVVQQQQQQKQTRKWHMKEKCMYIVPSLFLHDILLECYD